MEFMIEKEFKELEKKDKYWKNRWDYLKEVIEILKNEDHKKVIELGPYSKTIVKGSDVMDKNDRLIPDLKYRWNAVNVPWPIKDKQYDLFIGLQVFEHLYEKFVFPSICEGPKQKEAFDEVKRISKNAILSFPFRWDCPNIPSHHNITEEKIAEWTGNIDPFKKIIVGNKIIYYFKF